MVKCLSRRGGVREEVVDEAGKLPGVERHKTQTVAQTTPRRDWWSCGQRECRTCQRRCELCAEFIGREQREGGWGVALSAARAGWQIIQTN